MSAQNPNTTQNEPSQGSEVTLGPIIGKVTQTTARVLVEFSNGGTERLSLEAPNGTMIYSEAKTYPYRPAVFKYSGLEPNTTYKVGTDRQLKVEKSSFTTFGNQTIPSRFAFVSCNDQRDHYMVKDNANLWKDLSNRTQNREIDYLLHLGDQIYADFEFAKAIQIIENLDSKDWDSVKEHIRESYRMLYRVNFGSTYQAQAMANAPNLMILDDHEIANNWGWLKDDAREETAVGYVGRQGQWVYYEYQRQLWEDIDFDNIYDIDTEYHTHIIGDIGLFFLDLRGRRSWHTNINNENLPSYLGARQIIALNEALEPEKGLFANCTFTMVLTPIPVGIYEEDLLQFLEFVEKIIGKAFSVERWRYKHQLETALFLQTLGNWKRGRKDRELVLVGGDVHHSGFMTFYNRDSKEDDFEMQFHQLMTSGITQGMTSSVFFQFMKFGAEISRSITGEKLWQHVISLFNKSLILLCRSHSTGIDTTITGL